VTWCVECCLLTASTFLSGAPLFTSQGQQVSLRYLLRSTIAHHLPPPYAELLYTFPAAPQRLRNRQHRRLWQTHPPACCRLQRPWVHHRPRPGCCVAACGRPGVPCQGVCACACTRPVVGRGSSNRCEGATQGLTQRSAGRRCTSIPHNLVCNHACQLMHCPALKHQPIAAATTHRMGCICPTMRCTARPTSTLHTTSPVDPPAAAQ
jgi:hypothetical protein